MTTEELAAQTVIRHEKVRQEMIRFVVEQYPDLTAEEQVAKATVLASYIIS